MRVLVTGSDGFIGGYVVDELERQGHKAVLFDIKSDPFSDVRDPEQVAWAISGVDGVIHLAGILGTPETVEDPHPALETNILGTNRVLAGCSRLKKPVATILTGHGPLSHSPYAISKEAAGRLTEMYRKEKGLQVNQVRPVNAYGPRQSTGLVEKILPTFINHALRGEPLEIYGNGTQISDMVWVGDVAKVLVSALWYASKGRLLPTVEVGPAEPMTVNQIATNVIDEVEQQVPNGPRAYDYGDSVDYLPMRPGEARYDVHARQMSMMPYNILDNLKPWHEGLAETVRYYRALQDGELTAR